MAVADLPPVATPRLSPIERQWRELVWLCGWGAVIGVAGGGLAAILIADAFLNLPPAVRFSGLIVTGLLAVIAGWFRLLRPLLRGMTLADAAVWLERAHPELQERLRTCLDLEASSTGTSSRAAMLMQRQVRRETFALLEEVEVDDALPPQRAFRAFGLGLAALAVLIAPFGLWTTGYGLEWQRVFQPWGNHAWGRNWIVAGEPGDQLHPRGQDLTVTATAVHRRSANQQPEQLTLHWRPVGTQEWDERRLLKDDAGSVFAAVLPRLNADTEWFITGPASASPRYRVTVVDPPQITAFTAEIDPLPYTGLPSQQGNVLSELTAPIGSLIRLHVTFDRPVGGVDVQWPVLTTTKSGAAETTATAFTASADQRSATVRLRGGRSGAFQLTFRSPQGLAIADEPRRLTILRDEPPRVELEGGSSITVRPDDRINVAIAATDDFGLQAAEVQVTISEQDVRTTPLPIVATPEGWTWSHPVDVAALGLTPGQAATIRARVIDNRLWPSPQEAWSEPQVIVVSSSAPTAAERALMEQTNAARHDLQELLRELAAHRDELRDAHQKTAAAAVKQKDAEQDARLAELEAKQQDLTEQLKHWMEELPDSGPWQPIRAAAQDIFDGDLAQANEQLKQGREAEPREQIEHLSKALDELAAAQRELRRLDDAIRALGQLGPELGELAQLANRSERLAEALEQQPQPTPEQRAEAEQLQRDLERIIEDRPELKAAVEQALRAQAAADAKRAEELSQRQRELAEVMGRDQPTPDANRPADAAQPANAAAKPPSAEFAQGKTTTEQLQQAANESLQLADKLLNELGPDAAPTENAIEAARQLTAASEAAQQGKLADAESQAKNAHAQLAEAAKAIPPAAADTPAAHQTQQLANQSGQLAEQLSSLQNSPDAQRGAQAAAQQQLADAAKSLSPEPKNDEPSSAEPALNAAQQAMQQAQSALQSGDAPQAAEEARQAAESLSQAAQQLQSSAPMPADTASNPAGESLRTAERRLQSAQQQISQPPPETPNQTATSQSPPNTPMPSESPSPPGERQPSSSPMPSPSQQPPSNASPPGQPPLANQQPNGQEQSQTPPSQQPSGQQQPSQPQPSSQPQQSGQQQSGQQQSGQQPGQQGQGQQPGQQPGHQPGQQGQGQGQQGTQGQPGKSQTPSSQQGQPGQSQSQSQQGQQGQGQTGQRSQGQSPGQGQQGSSGQGPANQPQPGQSSQGQPGQPSGKNEANSAAAANSDNAAAMPPGTGGSNGVQSVPGAATDLRRAGDALRNAVDQLTGQSRSPSGAARPQVGTFRAPGAEGSDRPAEVLMPGGPASLEKLEQKLHAESQRNWGRLPGKLKTEILEGGRLPTHPEYARQIQRYFETIAQPATPPAEPQP